MAYYCNNCKNIVGRWNTKYKYYSYSTFCHSIKSKNINLICFLDCGYCNKFVGILCFPICKNCFGDDEIFKEENLFNWFKEYKKILEKYSITNHLCNICNMSNYRTQCWYFKELTFYKE